MAAQFDFSPFSLENIPQLLSQNPEQLFGFFEKCAKKELPISEIGIAFDRKLLYTWKKADLIPFLPEENTWMRFSFLDVLWLQLLLELREVGIGIEKLKKLKDHFFDPAFRQAFFSNLHTLDFPNAEMQSAIQEKLPVQKGKLIFNDDINRILDDIQLSLFSVVVYAVIYTRANWSLYIDEHTRIGMIDLNNLLQDPIAEVQALHTLLSEHTVAMVNLRKLIIRLTDSHEYFGNDLQMALVISENSVRVLQDLFSKNKVKEITFRMGDKGRPVIFAKRQISLDEFETELRKIRKKGNFSDVLVKTRDGQIQHFEKTELFKL